MKLGVVVLIIMLEEINETDRYSDLLLYQSELKVKRLENKISKLEAAIKSIMPIKPWTSMDKQFWSNVDVVLKSHVI